MADEKEFLADFCKKRQFSSYQEKRNFAAPLDVLDVTAFAPLSCNLISGHEQTDGAVILSNVRHQNGGYVGALYTTPGSPNDFAAPGPATALDAVRGLSLTGSPALPFPAAQVTSAIDYNLLGMLWWQEADDTQTFTPREQNSLATGFGSLGGPLRVLNLTGTAFRNSGGRFPYHNYTNHVLMPRVTASFDALGLTFNSGASRYEWPQTAPPGFTRIVTDSDIGTGESWGLAVYFYSVHAALVGFSGDLVDQQVFSPFSGNPNGPLQDRTYVYVPLETLDWPAYGGNVVRTYAIPGTPRPQSVVYTQSANSSGWSLSINGASVPSGAAHSIPTPQLVPFPPSALTGNTPFDQAAQMNVGFTTTTFTFSATRASKTLTTVPITISLSATPRYFEFLVSFFYDAP